LLGSLLSRVKKLSLNAVLITKWWVQSLSDLLRAYRTTTDFTRFMDGELT
jgi:hypothetical protein